MKGKIQKFHPKQQNGIRKGALGISANGADGEHFLIHTVRIEYRRDLWSIGCIEQQC